MARRPGPGPSNREVNPDSDLNNPLGIDVHAVVILVDALYKDIRLSGNRVRALRARRPCRW